MKHISSTPFRDASNELEEVQLPEEIQEYINTKYPSVHNIQEKKMLEHCSQKFWQTILKKLHTNCENLHRGCPQLRLHQQCLQ
ncbi:hypothetical protein VPH35_114482 [Triticum aestivum]